MVENKSSEIYCTLQVEYMDDQDQAHEFESKGYLSLHSKHFLFALDEATQEEEGSLAGLLKLKFSDFMMVAKDKQTLYTHYRVVSSHAIPCPTFGLNILLPLTAKISIHN